MQSNETELSKGQINKVGENIRASLFNKMEPSVEDLSKLQQYRKEFREPLRLASEELQRIMGKIDVEGIVTYRVKRIESILSKLERQPTMQLSRCNDIAGCRCILKNEKKVFQYLNELKSSNVLEIVTKKESDGSSKEYIYDYIMNPKKNGYKSIHVICKCLNKVIEIQIRDDSQHAWATLVEITDSIYRTKIKEQDNDFDTGLKDFLRLYSKGKQLTEEERKSINEILEKTKFIQKLVKTFKKNYPRIRKDWCELEEMPGNFYVFEVPQNNRPKYKIYEDFAEAENAYFKTVTSEVVFSKTNVLMAYVQKKDFATVSKAYANYFLVKHTLFDNLINIFSNDAHNDKVNQKSCRLAYLCAYFRIIINIDEIDACIDYNSREENIKKYDDWIIEIKNDISKSYELIHPKYNVSRLIFFGLLADILKLVFKFLTFILKIRVYKLKTKLIEFFSSSQ
ncbi:MAG: hypothetical protein IK002_05830 [Treponema sp.]|uniref:hypothetical protein n=1 Tax=Treponema sp. TaxID=166 RepID=UPI00298DD4DD|nr:hypothetical protein [Treponema sp.]MBR5933491.1 hypothetical protein [Treponema sp.]